MPATATVKMWGNTRAVRIPKALAQEAGLENGTQVTLSRARNGILVRRVAPARRKTYKLSALLAQCKGRNPNRELIQEKSGREIF